MKTLLIAEESTAQSEILGSKFIALAEPLATQQDLASLLTNLQERYPKASHYCYAAKVLSFEACSDDGEPARSAGVPFLDLLHKKEISYGAIVVVRYFGGTKLGAGRLARVYRETAAVCLNQAVFAEILPGLEAEVELDYSTFESLKGRAERSAISLKVVSFGERVRLLLRGDAKIVASWLSALPVGAILTQRDIPLQRRIEHDSKQ
jgi:putative IMPACT (imprinted ancient) family translation regulator